METKGRAATMLQEEQKKKKIIGAVTLILDENFEVDILPESVIYDNKILFNPNLVGIFRSFLEEFSHGLIFSEVISKYVEVTASEGKTENSNK